MSEATILVVLAVLFLAGLGLALAGFQRRTWPMVLLGAVLSSVPLGFATVVMGMPAG